MHTLAGNDYTSTTRDFPFTGLPVTVDIPILPDAIEDPDEVFFVMLGLLDEADGPLVLDVTTVVITDGMQLLYIITSLCYIIGAKR